MRIILYTTHCPKCNVLKSKLEEKNIRYEECSDTTVMLGFGIKTVPMLDIGEDLLLDFKAAVDWVNQQ